MKLRLLSILTFSIILFYSCGKDCWDTGAIDFEGSGEILLNGEKKNVDSYFHVMSSRPEGSLIFRYDTDEFRHEFSISKIMLNDSTYQLISSEFSSSDQYPSYSQIIDACSNDSNSYKLNSTDTINDYFRLTLIDSITNTFEGVFQMSFESNNIGSTSHPEKLIIRNGKFKAIAK
jgi:hypothetical protein